MFKTRWLEAGFNSRLQSSPVQYVHIDSIPANTMSSAARRAREKNTQFKFLKLISPVSCVLRCLQVPDQSLLNARCSRHSTTLGRLKLAHSGIDHRSLCPTERSGVARSRANMQGKRDLIALPPATTPKRPLLETKQQSVQSAPRSTPIGPARRVQLPLPPPHLAAAPRIDSHLLLQRLHG